MRGFSLVELSIVLVILGLLTGGILTGQNLIRAAELRSVTTEYSNYTTSVYTFRDKYFALPGDITNATAFWGKDNAACTTHTGTAATPGTCNGDGDGMLEKATANSLTGEIFQFWKQLALAGLVEGSYTGIAGPSTSPLGVIGHDGIIGTNVPPSKLGNVGWGAYYQAAAVGSPYSFDTTASNCMVVGRANTGWVPNVAAFKPEEAWNIDTKVDDGKPGRGFVVGSTWDDCTDATSSSMLDAEYLLTSTSTVCGLRITKSF